MLTVVILVQDELDHLKVLLTQTGFADRVLLVLNNPTTEVESYVQSTSLRYVKSSIVGNFAKLRNFALSKVKTKWVFFVDVDERISKELGEEILSIVTDGSLEDFDGYVVQREDVFLGKPLKYGEMKNAQLVRLGKRKAGTWKRKVHEYWDIPKTGVLTHVLLHYSHKTRSDFFSSVKDYARIEAGYRKELSLPVYLWELLTNPLGKFIYLYFIKLGFLDGIAGLIMCFGMSWHSFLVRYFYFFSGYNRMSLSLYRRVLRGLVSSFFVVYGLGQLGRMQFTQRIAVNGFELLAGIIFVWALLDVVCRKKFDLPKILMPYVGIASVLTFSYIIGLSFMGEAWLVPLMYLLRFWLYVVFAWAVYYIVSYLLDISIYRFLHSVGWMWLFGGVIQYAFFPDTRILYFLGWDDHYYRMIGTIFDPGFFALVMVFWMILDLQRNRKITIASLLGVSAVALSFSRSGYLVLVAVLGYFWIFQRLKTPALLLGAAFIGLIALAPKPGGEGVNLTRTYSISSRAESSVVALDVFSQKPLFGIGYNAYPLISNYDSSGLPRHPSGPDMSFAHILATTGIIGTVAICLLLIWQISLLKSIQGYGLISLLAMLLHSFTNNTFFYSFSTLWILLVMVLDAAGEELESVRGDNLL